LLLVKNDTKYLVHVSFSGSKAERKLVWLPSGWIDEWKGGK
jgi:hypothetical protein